MAVRVRGDSVGAFGSEVVTGEALGPSRQETGGVPAYARHMSDLLGVKVGVSKVGVKVRIN